MKQDKKVLSLKLVWKNAEETLLNTWPETEKIKALFEASEGDHMIPFEGEVNIFIPRTLSEKEISERLSQVYYKQDIQKTEQGYTINFS